MRSPFTANFISPHLTSMRRGFTFSLFGKCTVTTTAFQFGGDSFGVDRFADRKRTVEITDAVFAVQELDRRCGGGLTLP